MMARSPTHLVMSYWVLPGQFLAGEYPTRGRMEDTSGRLDLLLQAGIDTFIDLTEPGELEPYLPVLQDRAALRGISVTHRRFPIADFSLPERSTMLTILDEIDRALADGHKVYVHCHGGLGRTGMAVGCYLVRHGSTGPQALQRIEAGWRSISGRLSLPISPETPAQVRFVLDWREPSRAGGI